MNLALKETINFPACLGLPPQTVDIYYGKLFLRPLDRGQTSCTMIWGQASKRLRGLGDTSMFVRDIIDTYGMDTQQARCYPCIPMSDATGLRRFIKLLISLRTLDMMYEPQF